MAASLANKTYAVPIDPPIGVYDHREEAAPLDPVEQPYNQSMTQSMRPQMNV